MQHDTMRRSGGWCVELIVPIRHAGTELAAIELRAPDFEQVIKFGQNKYPSTLSLLSELAGIPETVLRTLSSQDSDRVLMAFYNIVPQTIKESFSKGVIPLATRDDLLVDQPRQDDPVDPRFPRAQGPVKRFDGLAVNPPKEEESAGFDAGIPQHQVKKVV